MKKDARFLLRVMTATCLAVIGPATWARSATREDARAAAIHPVVSTAQMQSWLARVPVTRDFPPDFAGSLRAFAPAFVIEMSTAQGCVPCADLWDRLGTLNRHYGWKIRTLSREDALLRSGRLGLPWVGHPVAWVRPVDDPSRMVPIAIGTDHAANLARNAWLAARMLTGVRAEIGVRALSKFTGIVGASPTSQFHR